MDHFSAWKAFLKIVVSIHLFLTEEKEPDRNGCVIIAHETKTKTGLT